MAQARDCPSSDESGVAGVLRELVSLSWFIRPLFGVSPAPERQAVRTALEKAAKDDMRPVSQLVQKIVADWLKERKYLK